METTLADNNAISEITAPATNKPASRAMFEYGIRYNAVYAIPFNGEKNLGEVGPIRKYVIDFEGMRLRSWQAYLESEICQIVLSRFVTWIVGGGLKLQAEPKKQVLAQEGIDINLNEFGQIVEERFAIYSHSSMADHSDMVSLNKLEHTAYLNAITGGDILVVLRLTDGIVTVQLIDGNHVGTPLGLNFNGVDYVNQSGNRVRNGVEIDSTGRHIGFYIRHGLGGQDFDYISARGANSGVIMAYLVKGLEYRLDNVRGMPLIAAVLETAKKMERYKEATLGSAEERQKVPFFFEHAIGSTGENPMVASIVKASGLTPSDDLPKDISGRELANTVAVTTNKQVFNMPQGATVKAIDTRNELSFPEFYGKNAEIICAVLNIPPEVAFSMYNSNFSASRAALKDWEHTVLVKRKFFAEQFLKPIYYLWLDVEVLNNKVQAPGYLAVRQKNNRMALEAYRFHRFVGSNVPHIDPLKEVQAERSKLGALATNVPLTTVEAATEAVNGGDSRANMEQFSHELEDAETWGIPNVSQNEKRKDEDINPAV